VIVFIVEVVVSKPSRLKRLSKAGRIKQESKSQGFQCDIKIDEDEDEDEIVNVTRL
jgi:hypothetical protein